MAANAAIAVLRVELCCCRYLALALGGDEPDRPFGRLWRGHPFAQRVMRGGQCPHTLENAHDLDVDGNGVLTQRFLHRSGC